MARLNIPEISIINEPLFAESHGREAASELVRPCRSVRLRNPVVQAACARKEFAFCSEQNATQIFA